MLDNAALLFANFVELAQYQPKESGHSKSNQIKHFKWNLPLQIATPEVLNMFALPLQAYLAMNHSNHHHSTLSSDSSFPIHNTCNNSDNNMNIDFIQSVLEQVDVAASKAKPKTITLTTTKGNLIKFLCKQEKNGDLRKDARMMEFNHVVNRLLSSELQSRTRNMTLRTFSVICLNEECGLLEWVNNTNCIRHLINAAHQQLLDCPGPNSVGLDYTVNDYNISTPTTTTTSSTSTSSHSKLNAYTKYNANLPSGNKEFYQLFMSNQAKYETDFDQLVTHYKELVLNRYHPCFHLWFLEQFPDPMKWLESRLLFTSSCAVWCVVGYAVGLGDRHTENIMLDVNTGSYI